MEKVHIGAAISGGGRTLLNFLELIDKGELEAEVTSVVSSSPSAGGIKHAEKYAIPVETFRRRDFSDDHAYSSAIFDFFGERECDLVCLAGFLKFVYIPPEWEGRVMNIHPALIPAFCGKNLYGRHVHEAVVKAGVKISGCTVHFADNEYDHGPIILQRPIPVYDTDTPDDVADRVFREECTAYPQAIRLYREERLKIEDGVVKILPEPDGIEWQWK